MKDKKFEIPMEIDAAIMQYAAEKKFCQLKWYRSLAARAAALVFVGAVLAYVQFFPDRNVQKIEHMAEKGKSEMTDWNDFEEKMEFVDNEILAEAIYLAQL